MEKAKIKALIGAALMLFAALILLVLGISMASARMPEYDPYSDEEPVHFESIGIANEIGGFLTKVGLVFLASGTLGVVGVILIGKRNGLSGALITLSGVIALFTVIGLVSAILLISAGVKVTDESRLAASRDKQRHKSESAENSGDNL